MPRLKIVQTTLSLRDQARQGASAWATRRVVSSLKLHRVTPRDFRTRDSRSKSYRGSAGQPMDVFMEE
jgi:hypothetical protein